MTTMHSFPINDFSTMDDDALAAAVSTLAAHIHAATYRLLVLIAELDRREVWAAQGALSCAHWLSWACGIDTHTAREKVRVARALTELPLLSEALAKGELGYSKVRALTRIASPKNEADLLNIGRHGTAQHVEKFVRLYRRAKRAEETEQANSQHENRGLTFWHEDDGTVVLHGRFPPEMGARILGALDAAMAAHEEEQPAAGWDDEGLAPGGVHVGRLARTHPPPVLRPEPVLGNPSMDNKEATPAHRPPTSHVGRTSQAPRARCAAPMRWRGWPSGCSKRAMPRRSRPTGTKSWSMSKPKCSRTEARGAAKSSTARPSRRRPPAGSVATPASSPVVDGPKGEPLSVGRRTRSIPPAVRRALSNRDRGCRFPGCPATQRLHGHHVRHWAEGGETSLDNLVLLCPTHHRLVHEGGFDVERLDDGAFRFTNPYGVAIRPPQRRETSSPETIIIRNASLGLAIDCETATRALARRAHRLRPRADGRDGIVGFGRHAARGGARGWGLEPVVGDRSSSRRTGEAMPFAGVGMVVEIKGTTGSSVAPNARRTSQPVCRGEPSSRARTNAPHRPGGARTVRRPPRCERSKCRRKLMPSSTWSPIVRSLTVPRTRCSDSGPTLTSSRVTR